MSIALAAAGLVLFALFDAGSVWEKQGPVWKSLFWAGCALWIWAFIHAFRRSLSAFTAMRALFLIPCALFALLTVYAIFFAIPFDGTALKGEQKVYTGGVYSLCRHPGVTFFLPALTFMVLAFPAGEMIRAAIALGTGDILYALMQDLWSFPRTLSGYDEYKKHTRFLLIDPRAAIKLITASERNKHES